MRDEVKEKAKRKARRQEQSVPAGLTKSRIIKVALLMALLCFGLVAIRLTYMDTVKYDYYVQKATTLQTRDSLVTPNRGTIYDCNMEILAESASTERVIVDPHNVVSEAKVNKGVTEEEQQEMLAKILSEYLDLKYETVLAQVQNMDSQYQIIAQKVDKDTMNDLNEALSEENCTGVDSEPDTKRYYRHGSYLSAVLGYVRDDGVGALGLEAEYDSELAGTAGRIVRAQNGNNQDMPYSYEEYIPATDGNNLVLTIDSEIQSYLEKHLETALADNPDARDGVTGMVMNVKTGEVLAMATLPDFDPNSPRTVTDTSYIDQMKKSVQDILTEKGVTATITDAFYQEGGLDNLPEAIRNDDELVDAVGQARLDILNKMWRNAVISDTYEPGSTFKLMNLSTAIDSGAIKTSDTFYCGGSLMVGDWSQPISCWNTGGHGTQTTTEALMNSCNVAMMEMSFQTGLDTFYDYFKAYGLLDKTGIDLPGEGQGLFHKVDDSTAWNEVSLAVASFGQRFNVTPIEMLNMTCAIVDDGKLKQPYVVKEVQNGDGSVKSSTEPTVLRQVISADTSQFMREAMEQVVENGTGKNAYVAGYRVGGKTATSELLPDEGDIEDRYTASFIGVAPMDDPQIAVIVLVNDLPESATHGGGAVAAPVVGRIMEDVLPYIGVTSSYSNSEDDRREVSVPSLIGKTEADAAASLATTGLTYRVVGEGSAVTDQVPANGVKIPSTGSVILYMGENKPTELIEVPDLSGLSPDECEWQLADSGLYMRRKGVATSQTTSETAASKQNPVAGTKVSIGSVITVEFSNSSNIGD